MRKLDIPSATAEQWERAFREAEINFSRNKSRMWVLKILASHLHAMVKGQYP